MTRAALLAAGAALVAGSTASDGCATVAPTPTGAASRVGGDAGNPEGDVGEFEPASEVAIYGAPGR